MRIGRLGSCFALAGLLLFGGQATAVIGTIDDVPAATLLLPYFEVECDNDGLNTLFSINNASATAVLAHVTFWTDQSVPALDFDVYLTGYDVQTISIRDILCSGNLPRTASDGQDPQDHDQPAGPGVAGHQLRLLLGAAVHQPDGERLVPFAHLQPALSGHGRRTSRRPAPAQVRRRIGRGYVTVDTENACNLSVPSDWVFSPVRSATDQNVLWGDYFYVDTR